MSKQKGQDPQTAWDDIRVSGQGQPADQSSGSLGYPVMGFGRHRDETIDKIPVGYLEWALRDANYLRPELRLSIELFLGKEPGSTIRDQQTVDHVAGYKLVKDQSGFGRIDAIAGGEPASSAFQKLDKRMQGHPGSYTRTDHSHPIPDLPILEGKDPQVVLDNMWTQWKLDQKELNVANAVIEELKIARKEQDRKMVILEKSLSNHAKLLSDKQRESKNLEQTLASLNRELAEFRVRSQNNKEDHKSTNFDRFRVVVKRWYRDLCRRYHPDSGGEEKSFKMACQLYSDLTRRIEECEKENGKP